MLNCSADQQQIATPPVHDAPDPSQRIENIGGGGWTRTNDLGIMSPSGEIEGKEDKALSQAESSKVRQNPQHGRNKKSDQGRGEK
jgi:hypothetical protein